MKLSLGSAVPVSGLCVALSFKQFPLKCPISLAPKSLPLWALRQPVYQVETHFKHNRAL